MTRCPSDATKPHPKGIAARLADEWLEPVPHADKPDPVLLLNLVERIGSALHAAATEARRGALEEAAGIADEIESGLTYGHSDAGVGAGRVAAALRTLAAKEGE